MQKITIKNTNNPSILKFELDFIITKNKSYEFKNIDETKNSPLAMQLFYLPFVKTVYVSGNFIAIEKFSIVDWKDVQEEVAQQIEDYVNSDKKIIIEEESLKKLPITVYAETTPNPSTTKFVFNRILTARNYTFKNIDETKNAPLAKVLFEFSFVKELFFEENYISITKYDIYNWEEITLNLRSFLKEYVENGNVIIDEDIFEVKNNIEKEKDIEFEKLDTTSQQIINILEEYVKPAVQSDGGNIVFDSFNAENNTVSVIMQGACNGCPSSTFTLKNGIETMLRQMLNNEKITVVAL